MVTEDESVDLYCRTRGRPTPTIRWLKNDEPLQQNERIVVKGEQYEDIMESDSWLTLVKSVLYDDDGVYSIEAVNEAAVATHRIDLTGKELLWNPVTFVLIGILLLPVFLNYCGIYWHLF